MEECRAFIGKVVLVASLISTLTSLTNGIPNFLDRILPAFLVDGKNSQSTKFWLMRYT